MWQYIMLPIQPKWMVYFECHEALYYLVSVILCMYYSLIKGVIRNLFTDTTYLTCIFSSVNSLTCIVHLNLVLFCLQDNALGQADRTGDWQSLPAHQWSPAAEVGEDGLLCLYKCTQYKCFSLRVAMWSPLYFDLVCHSCCQRVNEPVINLHLSKIKP